AMKQGLETGFGCFGSEIALYSQFAFLYPTNPPKFETMALLDELCERLMVSAPTDSVNRCLYTQGVYLHPFFKPMDEVYHVLERSLILSKESGNTSFTCISVLCLIDYGIGYALPVSFFVDIEEKYGKMLAQHGGMPFYALRISTAHIKALITAEEPQKVVREDHVFDRISAVEFFLHLRHAVLFDRPNQRQILNALNSCPEATFNITTKLLDCWMYSVIITTREWVKGGSDTAKQIASIRTIVDLLKPYIDQNKSHEFRLHICLAELAKIEEVVGKAVDHYETAITQAHHHGSLMHEALANELFGQFWLHRKSTKMAKTCLNDAFNLWFAWGAEGKCKEMASKHGDLIIIAPHLGASGHSGSVMQSRKPMRKITQYSKFSKTTQSNENLELDAVTIMKVAHAIRNETSLEALLKRIMTYVVVNAGATKGVLALNDSGVLTIEAVAVLKDNGDEQVTVLQGLPIDTSDEKASVPLSVVQFAFRTKDSVVLEKAIQDQTHGTDGYILKNRPCSVMCVPIIHHQTVTGVVYLENNLQTDAFNAGRIDLIQSLMPTASMSIENARLAKANTELVEALRGTANPVATRKYTIDAPIKRMIDILQGLKSNLSAKGDPTASKIDYILTTLTSNDIFASSMDDINDQTGRGIDRETKMWIENSLLQKASKTKPLGRSESREHMMSAAATLEASLEEELYEDRKNEELAKSRRRTRSIAMLKFKSPINFEEIQAYMENNVSSLSFDVFKLGELTEGQPLFFLSLHLLEKFQLTTSLSIDEDKLRNFFKNVEKSYKPQPFHNSLHAADVLHVVHLLLLSDSSVAKNFTKLEIFSAFIAAAVHDVDHPAVNNNFLIQSSHPLAVFYNDLSVLEFHHASRAFEIAANAETNIFESFTLEDRKAIRKMVIAMVVATDLTKHFHYINTLKSKLAASSVKFEEPADRSLILDVAIKCADLSNPTRGLEISKKWAVLVLEEFFNQGERERELGLPVSMFMDRAETNIPKCQMGFIDLMVEPLFEVWSQCVALDVSQECLKNISNNRAYWESILSSPELVPEVPKTAGIPIDLRVSLEGSNVERPATSRRNKQRGSISGAPQPGLPAPRNRKISVKLRRSDSRSGGNTSDAGKSALSTTRPITATNDTTKTMERRRSMSQQALGSPTKNSEGNSILKMAKASFGFGSRTKVNAGLPSLPKANDRKGSKGSAASSTVRKMSSELNILAEGGSGESDRSL
ncbi:cAMP-specific 3',5'-cyclic phosphodiesterase 4D, partial [Irineochytrium annulatum]